MHGAKEKFLFLLILVFAFISAACAEVGGKIYGRRKGPDRLGDCLSQPQSVAPGTLTCGPFGENLVYTRADGTIVNGTRSPYPNTIGTDAVYQNIGNANYNSLQASLKRTAGPLTRTSICSEDESFLFDLI